MSQKIPFLQMFAALRQGVELSNGVEGWLIVSAAIDKASRSAKIVVEGAAGAGPNLVAQAEEAVCRAYGLNSVKIEAVPAPEPPVEHGAPSDTGAAPEKRQAEAVPPENELDPFARTEAIRKAALKKTARPAASPSSPAKGEKKPKGKTVFGRTITKAPTPIGELELDMGMVVVEGDVFAIDNRELKKRGAWVVAFDMTDYTEIGRAHV